MTDLKPMLSASHARKMIETSMSKANALNVPCSIAEAGAVILADLLTNVSACN